VILPLTKLENLSMSFPMSLPFCMVDELGLSFIQKRQLYFTPYLLGCGRSTLWKVY
jgi:hypothetical protein